MSSSARQAVPQRRVGAGADLQPHGAAEPAPPQLHLDRHQQVVGLVLLDRQVGVAGHPEGVVLADGHPGEQGVEVGGDDLLEGDEALAVGHTTKRGRTGGTFTRAIRCSPVPGSPTSTSRLSERFEM